MPQCICCVLVNRSPKYTTDRLETKQYSPLSKLLTYTQNKQSLKSYFTQAHKCPSASAVYRQTGHPSTQQIDQKQNNTHNVQSSSLTLKTNNHYKVTSHRHINAPVHLLCTGKQVTQVNNRQIRNKTIHTTFEPARLHSKQTIIKKLLHTGT